jgi:hypothetical protein
MNWSDLKEHKSYSAMLNIAESVPPTASVSCDSGIPPWQHPYKRTEFLRIPTNSNRFRNLNIHALVFEWSVKTIDRIPLWNSRSWKEFLLIPKNSGITTYMGLFVNDSSSPLIEFPLRYSGIIIYMDLFVNQSCRPDQAKTFGLLWSH